MNNRRDKANSTNRARTIVLCVFAFIALSGLMVLGEYSELKDAEKRERQIHKIKTLHREIEAQRHEVVQLLQEITDRQAHYKTADHHHPHAEQQLADLARQRKRVEELLRQSDRQLARCEQMLQELAD